MDKEDRHKAMLDDLRGPIPPKPEDVTVRSEKLLKEFKEHAAEVTKDIKTNYPDKLFEDEAMHEIMLFEGWVTQKVAGLQLLFEYQAEVINTLINDFKSYASRNRR